MLLLLLVPQRPPVLVCCSTESYLLAAKTVLGKLLLMARGAVDVVSLGQETLRAYWLLAFEASEALLVPHFVLVLHILRAFKWRTSRDQAMHTQRLTGDECV